MRLIIIDDINTSEIADILGTRSKSACLPHPDDEKWPGDKKAYPILGNLIGKTVQIDDPHDGYIKGVVESVDVGYQTVLLDCREKWFEAKYISGIIS